MRKVIAALALATTFGAGAMEIQEGEIACRSGKALTEINQAIVEGNQEKVDWILHSLACFRVPADTVVELKEQSMGWQQVRTTDRRKNMNLWISSNSLVADNG